MVVGEAKSGSPTLATGTIGPGGNRWLTGEQSSFIIFCNVQSEVPGGHNSPEIVKDLLYPNEDNYVG